MWLAGFLQTDIRAADFALQLGPAGIMEHRRIGAPPNAGKGRLPFGTPLSAPAFQQFRTQLVFPRSFTLGRAGIQGAHGGDLQIATVNRSGQIHSSLRSMYLVLNFLFQSWGSLLSRSEAKVDSNAGFAPDGPGIPDSKTGRWRHQQVLREITALGSAGTSSTAAARHE